jgi:hypothetical protein
MALSSKKLVDHNINIEPPEFNRMPRDNGNNLPTIPFFDQVFEKMENNDKVSG